MSQQSESLNRAKELVRRSVEEYVTKRRDYYLDRRKLLNELLKKDVMLWALRGAATADDWLQGAFSAHESSSEETMMGNAWQRILADLSEHSVGAGDLLIERDNVLWVVEMKSQTNTLNGVSRPQTVRTLKLKTVAQSRIRHPGRRGVRAMIGVIRGSPDDRERTYSDAAPENMEIQGFQYREMVGAPFRAWLTGLANPLDLIENLEGHGQSLASARQNCLERLSHEIHQLLSERNLPDDIQSILAIAAGSDS